MPRDPRSKQQETVAKIILSVLFMGVLGLLAYWVEVKAVVPRGNGFRQALGQLIVCPTCVGTWVAAVLVALMLVYPAGTRIFLYATAAVGLAEILHSLTEVLCWTARNARTSSGYVMEKKKAIKEQHESLISHSHDV